jgi:hypothetical protein
MNQLKLSRRMSLRSLPESGALRHEYDKSLDLIKHYATIQFAQLSVYIAMNGAALSVLFGSQPYPLTDLHSFLATAFLAITCLLFFVMQESHMYLVSHFLRRAASIEIQLKYKGLSQFPGMPEYKFSPAKWSLRLFYLAVLLGWATLALRSAHPALLDLTLQQVTEASRFVPSDPKASR